MGISSVAMATTGLEGRVLGRDLTVSGICLAAARVSMEQLAGQATTTLGGDVARLVAHLPTGRIPLAEILMSWLGGVLDVAGLHGGPLSIVGMLLLPVGGPIWAGVVPPRITVRTVRTGAALLPRVAGAGAVTTQSMAARIGAFTLAPVAGAAARSTPR